jgi:N-acetyl-anhydromuramyl-L-alanine amidase AmpD
LTSAALGRAGKRFLGATHRTWYRAAKQITGEEASAVKVPFIPYVQGRNDYTDGDEVKYGIAIHNTSNDASDTGEATYATRRTDGVSAHFYVDADSATQSIDTDDKTGHAGSAYGNENAISVEITGANGWSRAQWLANVAWNTLGRVLAAVIRHHWPDGSFQVRRATVDEMKRNPKVRALYGHDDMRRAWGGTTHTDPGPDFPWDRLISAVSTALAGEADMSYSQAQMKAFTWQYDGGGIGENTRAGTGTTNRSTLSYFDEVLKTVRLIAGKVDIDPAELLAIQNAAEAGAKEAFTESADAFVKAITDGVLAGLDPANITIADVEAACERAVRDVLVHGVGTSEDGASQ